MQEGDTLSGIAETHGVADWHQVWEASKGMAEPGGQHLTDPDLIRPGWTVEIPVATLPTSRPTRTIDADPADAEDAPATDACRADTGPGDPGGAPASSGPAFGSRRTPPRTARQPSGQPAREELLAGANGGVRRRRRPARWPVSLAALLRYRRRQFRWRHPGRTISPTPPELQRVEHALLSTGTAGMADVTWLNEALRSLVHSLAATGTGRLPDVVAVRMTADNDGAGAGRRAA